MYFFKITFLGLFLFVWASCANVMTPTGGEKDMIPPKISKRSIKDSSLNFKGGNIEFEFDEFIQIKDLQNQLVVSPFMKVKPKVTAHKKKLSVQIPDSLLESNTTYRVNFGNAISDLHEGNPFPNFNFTFSTGAYFDSLTLRGNVIDAKTGMPDTSVVILLYAEKLSDTAVKNSKPLYIQKPVYGSFDIGNLPNKSFHIYALQDLNMNLQYDLPNEKFAFINKKVNPNELKSGIVLYTFQEEVIKDTTPSRQARVNNFMSKDKNAPFTFSTNIDTIRKKDRTFSLKDTIKISFTNPISTFDESKIRLYQDDVLDATSIIILDSSRKVISFKTDWQADGNYSLQIKKGFAIDSNSKKNDSALFVFKTKRLSDYGKISFVTEKKPNHWVELIQNNKVISRKNATDTLVKFDMLDPGNYQARILNDENENSIWDTGNFSNKKLPEIVEYFSTAITVKANWENKVKLIIENRQKEARKP